MRTKTRARPARSWVGAALLALAPVAGAQQATPEPFSLDEYAARQTARIALFDLRMTPSPAERDYRIASLLLSICEELRPQDQEILRRRIEAAWAAGDTTTVIRETERLLVLDPKDTVAQLRLITSRLAQLQTAESRLAAYDKFLDTSGPGRHLDASIRSRLALDAALLHRERGEEEAFVEKLTRSVQLDPTHKEAAALAVAYASPRVGAMERLDLLANVLMADPVDPNVHLAIANELTIGGAYKGAARFLAVARRIFHAAGGSLEEFDQRDLVLRWYQKGPRAVVEVINNDRMGNMEAVTKRLQLMHAYGIPTDREMKPEDVAVAPIFAFVSALALDAAGDRPAVEAMVQSCAATSARIVQSAIDPQLRPSNMTEQQAIVQSVTVTAELQILRLWTNTQIEGVQAALNEQGPLVKYASATMPLLKGWLKLRTGDARGAVADLEPLADNDPASRVAFAQALEQAGDLPRALEQYERLVRDGPLTPAGAWSRWHLGLLGVALDQRRVEELEQWADIRPSGAVPVWVDRAVEEPPMILSAILESTTCDAVDGTRLRLTIENTAPRPLALGPDRPINSRLLLAPKLEVPLGPLAQFARPEVVDVDRRLRLMPRERLEVLVWPDAGESGWLLELLCAINMRVRWRVIQGFWIDPQGGYEPGPMCRQTETAALVRRSLPESTMPVGEHLKKIEGDSEDLLPRAAAGLRTVLMVRPPEDAAAPDQPTAEDPALKAVAEAWARRWTRLSPAARMMAAAVIPNKQFTPALGALDDVMRAETDPRILAIVLVTRVTDPADELLRRSRESQDARVAELARLVGDRLTEGTKVTATLTPRDLWAQKEQAQAPR